MNNLEITVILEISIIGLAVVQALTILLTIRRERDIKEPVSYTHLTLPTIYSV